MPIKLILKKGVFLLKHTIKEFIADNALQLSAALSTYILFSLTPLLIVIIYTSSIVLSESAVSGEVYEQIKGLVGDNAALEIQEVIKSVKLSPGASVAGTISIIVSLIAASGVFAEIQRAVNFMWGIKTSNKRGLLKFLLHRLLSFIIIGTTGILLFIGLLANTLMDVIENKLILTLPDEINISFYYFLNILILFALIVLLFVAIFKILPDAKIAIKDCLIGACFTALLFMLGKYAVGTYLGSYAVTSLYGAAGTLIFILAWVYYSAIIFYLGVEFTKVFARAYGQGIMSK